MNHGVYIKNTQKCFKIIILILSLHLQDCDPTKQLQTHVVGVLVHGKNTHIMYDMNQFAHDTNLTINCMMYGLTMEAIDQRLTPELSVQLDNCGRENKNKYFLGFMGLLVARRYVDEITMSFLMVGHTHEGRH